MLPAVEDASLNGGGDGGLDGGFMDERR